MIDDSDIFRGNVEAGDDIDRALIDFGISEIAIIRAPPIAGIAIHFFLRDKLCDAISNRFVWFRQRRQQCFITGGEIDGIDGAIANETDMGAARRDFRIVFERVSFGELARFWIALSQGHQMQVTADRNQDCVRRPPIVGDNAFASGNAFAFAQGFFLFRQFDVFRFQEL